MISGFQACSTRWDQLFSGVQPAFKLWRIGKICEEYLSINIERISASIFEEIPVQVQKYQESQALLWRCKEFKKRRQECLYLFSQELH